MSSILKFALLLLPTLVYSHTGDTSGGFATGFNHPVLGFDHLLAMVSVGMVSSQMGGKALWSVPATFVLVMLGGGVMGMQGVPLFSVEIGIALSVLVLGLAIAIDKKIPVAVVMAFVGFFAVFHGHAHGTEMPLILKPYMYALGFMTGTTIIHIVGVIIGEVCKKQPEGKNLLRHIGSGIAGIGIHLLLTR